jgi:hypothetical protein
MAEVKSLGKHLGADEHIQLSFLEVPDHFAGPDHRTGGICVEPAHPDPFKDQGQLVFDLFRAKPLHAHMRFPAGRAAWRHGLFMPAIMALQLPADAMIGQAHIAAPTPGNVSAFVAYDVMRISPPVLEKDDLFPPAEGFPDCPGQLRREVGKHLLPLDGLFDVGHHHLRGLHATKPVFKFHIAKLFAPGIVKRFKGGSGCPHQHPGIVVKGQHLGCVPGMITGGRIVLLIGGFVLLVDEDQPQLPERQENG